MKKAKVSPRKVSRKPATKTKRSPVKRKPTTSKAVALRKEPDRGVVNRGNSLSLANPHDVMAFGKVLKKYIKENNLSVTIQGNEYAMVDGWKFAGLNFGLTAIPSKPVLTSLPGQYVKTLYVMKDFTKNGKSWQKEVVVFTGFVEDQSTIDQVKEENKISREITRPYFAYECECHIQRLSDGVVTGYGLGFCSNLEELKSGFDQYAVNSMAQTRSIGKAYRNLIGYVMKSAGLESTPAEEMVDVDYHESTITYDEPKLPQPTAGQWSGIKTKIKTAEVTMSEVKKHFTLTQDMEKEIDALINAKA